MNMPPNKTVCIFDMDGLLINSEPLWQLVEIKIFSAHNVPLTPELCQETHGMRLDEMIVHWQNKFDFPITLNRKIQRAIIQELRRLISKQNRSLLLPGALEILNLLKEKQIPCALASSSPEVLIESIINMLDLSAFFQHTLSAQHETYGKPHPSVFLKAAERLNASPHQCIVFEDSVAGLIAAKAAQMYCVVIPNDTQLNNPHYCLADKKFRTLNDAADNWISLKTPGSPAQKMVS